MKRLTILLVSLCTVPLVAKSNTLLFSDNFNTADTGNLDTAPLDGRLSGSLATTTKVASVHILQGISGNRLRMLPTGTTDGRVRFQDAASGAWLDWAQTATGPAILADGGMRIEFDWVSTNNTSDQWISMNIGHPGQAVQPEAAQRVNHGETDYGILLRNNGQSQRFDNGANLGNGSNFIAVTTTRHVVIDLSFNSFADSSSVSARTTVNGELVATDSFTWAGNAGSLYMELATNSTGQLIDNYTVATKPGFAISLDDASFASGAPQGTAIGSLSAAIPGSDPETSTFTLVSGEGSTDNSLFQISGDQLQTGNYDFTADTPGITSYSIRVRATGGTSGATGESVITLTMLEDDDFDGLPDAWEYFWTIDDLALLDGEGLADFDGDGLTDLQEYEYSLEEYPEINPMAEDTDGDFLTDFEEIQGAGSRPPTNPTLIDTDGDGLDDLVETNTGVYDDLEDTGTDPTLGDTDGDGARDAFEIDHGSSPLDYASRPVLPASVAMGLLTDDVSTGISATKNYTHAISGGAAATVNGVNFAALTATETPANFAWNMAGAGAKGFIVNNAGTWNATSGGVTGEGLVSLLNSFTFPTAKTPGSYQSFVLSGLTPGASYEARLLMRTWNPGGTGRPIDLVFLNGGEQVQPFGALLEDRPHVVFDNGNANAAFYVSYTYVAQATEMEIRAMIPFTESAANEATGGFHLYALTNEMTSVAPGSNLKITSVSKNSSGEVVIDFTGDASTSYQVTKSADLSESPGFLPLTIPLSVTTDSAGLGQAIVPASEASEAKEFYRIETTN